MSQTHSFSCNSPQGHFGACRPAVHRCWVPCSYDLENEDGDYQGNVSNRALAERVIKAAAAEGLTWHAEERCECDEEDN